MVGSSDLGKPWDADWQWLVDNGYMTKGNVGSGILPKLTDAGQAYALMVLDKICGMVNLP